MAEEETKKTVKKKTTKKVAKKSTEKKTDKVEENVEEKESSNWIAKKPSEVEEIIIELAKEGKPSWEIGMILRDKHGVPSVKGVLGKKIEKVLKEKGIEYKTEKNLIEEKIESIKKHISKNKHDYNASRALTKRLWALRAKS